MRFDQHDWRKGEVTKILPHRSYAIRTEDGPTFRRTSRHVRLSAEQPIQIKADPDEDDETVDLTQRGDGGDGHGSQEPTQQEQQQQRPADTQPQIQSEFRTRAGRLVKIPERYKP